MDTLDTLEFIPCYEKIIISCARISATYSCQYFFLSHGILTTTFSHITHHLPYVYIVQLRQLKTQQIIYNFQKKERYLF